MRLFYHLAVLYGLTRDQNTNCSIRRYSLHHTFEDQMVIKHELEKRKRKTGGWEKISSRRDVLVDVKQIEFNSAWFDDEGLPIHVHQWALNNLKPDEAAVGVRLMEDKLLPFRIQRYTGANKTWARFELFDGTVLVALPGVISYLSKTGNKLQRRYHEYCTAQGSTWKLVCERQMVSYRTYHDCPTITAFAMSDIDAMMRKLTGVSDRRLSSFLFIWGPGNPFQDPGVCRPTSDTLQKIYALVREHANRETGVYDTPATAEEKAQGDLSGIRFRTYPLSGEELFNQIHREVVDLLQQSLQEAA